MATEPEMSPQAHLRHYLREWREFRNLRQEDLAKLVGVSESIISRYETGRRGISLLMQIKFMRVLDIMPNQFWSPPDAPSLDAMAANLSPSKRKLLVNLVRVLLDDLETE
jgi:transcriptional regulator with XRE-family HTH domain